MINHDLASFYSTPAVANNFLFSQSPASPAQAPPAGAQLTKLDKNILGMLLITRPFYTIWMIHSTHRYTHQGRKGEEVPTTDLYSSLWLLLRHFLI